MSQKEMSRQELKLLVKNLKSLQERRDARRTVIYSCIAEPKKREDKASLGNYGKVEEKTKTVISCDDFVLIEAESLSKRDAFLKYEPKTEIERKIKELIRKAIKKKIKNFEHLRFAPFFTDANETDICFESFETHKVLATGKSYEWWEFIAQKLNLKLGTRLQYAAFLGLLIKKLVEEGKTIEWAWNAVCNDADELRRYLNSEDAKNVGSRSIFGLCDIFIDKILAKDQDSGGFWCTDRIVTRSIAHIFHCTNPFYKFYGTVGWLVR